MAKKKKMLLCVLAHGKEILLLTASLILGTISFILIVATILGVLFGLIIFLDKVLTPEVQAALDSGLHKVFGFLIITMVLVFVVQLSNKIYQRIRKVGLLGKKK